MAPTDDLAPKFCRSRSDGVEVMHFDGFAKWWPSAIFGFFKIRIFNDRRGSELFCVIASDSVHAHVVVIEVFVQYFRSTATLSFLFLARGRRGTTLL